MELMATTIRNMSSFPLQYPSEGRLQIRMITRAMMPGLAPSTLGDNSYEFHFNPLFHLSSLWSAFAFFLGRLTAVDSADVVYPIAAFAFDQVRSRNWVYGLSLSVVLETVYVLEEPEPRSHIARADFLDGQMILNDTTLRDYYDFRFDSEDDSVGMSEHEICMLKTHRLISDDEEGESECCCICLEGFMRGMVITLLAPCSHRFHNSCIAQWLHKHRTCPICRADVV